MSRHFNTTNKVRLIAFYLPQFHPTPENDLWWGKGFTEWTNVSRARPNYNTHYQPQLPADLGFYDLRLSEIREQQAQLAVGYGISGFCYYYYWFGGKKLLNRPIEEVLSSGKPDFPFCLCWANENWTRRWDGFDNEILIAQTYSDEDIRNLIRSLIPAFSDPRYIRVDNRPLFLLYRASLLPDPLKTAEAWREECRNAGLGEIYLCAVQSLGVGDPRQYGFDAAVEFPPHGTSLPNISSELNLVSPDFRGYVVDYIEYASSKINLPLPDYKLFRTVIPRWDNTARLQNRSWIFHGSTPQDYEYWLRRLIKQTMNRRHGDERIVFINAWNEWAEGAYLEPDRKFGHQYLEATRNALSSGDCLSELLDQLCHDPLLDTETREQVTYRIYRLFEEQENSIESATRWMKDQEEKRRKMVEAQIEQKIAEREKTISSLRSVIKEKEQALLLAQSQLTSLTTSNAWKVLQGIWKITRAIAPPGSKRAEALKLALRPLRAWKKRSAAGSAERGWNETPGKSLESFLDATNASEALSVIYNMEVLPQVSIVIPVYNNLHYTTPCVESIYNSETGVNFEVIVVNNNSQDGTAKWLKSFAADHSNFRYINNNSNLGFAGGVNRGIAVASGSYVAIVNNDTLVTPGWLDWLVKAAESDPCLGIVSPVTNYVGEGPQIDHDAIDIEPQEILEHARRLSQQDKPLMKVIDRLTFFCVLIKRDLFDILGEISGVYGLGNFEDDDFCLRARLAGYTLAIQPKSFVFHFGSRTFKEQKISHDNLMERNRRIYYERVASFSTHLLPHSVQPVQPPNVSIIVRTVDRPLMLRRALTSLANQTLRSFEVVVVNDGGLDVSAILEEFSRHLSIRYILHDNPRGRTAALNSGLRAAGGEWIGYLDDDDIIYPTHLEHLMNALNNNSEALVAYCDTNRVLSRSTPEGEVVIARIPTQPFEYDSDELLVNNRIPIQSYLHSMRCIDRTGLFDESFDVLEDWEFLIRLSRSADFYRVPRVTSEYRFRIGKTSDNSITQVRESTLEVIKRIYDMYPPNNQEVAMRREQLIEDMRKQIYDLDQIEQHYSNEIERNYLTISRVAGFVGEHLSHTGYRA